MCVHCWLERPQSVRLLTWSPRAKVYLFDSLPLKPRWTKIKMKPSDPGGLTGSVYFQEGDGDALLRLSMSVQWFQRRGVLHRAPAGPPRPPRSPHHTLLSPGHGLSHQGRQPHRLPAMARAPSLAPLLIWSCFVPIRSLWLDWSPHWKSG